MAKTVAHFSKEAVPIFTKGLDKEVFAPLEWGHLDLGGSLVPEGRRCDGEGALLGSRYMALFNRRNPERTNPARSDIMGGRGSPGVPQALCHVGLHRYPPAS